MSGGRAAWIEHGETKESMTGGTDAVGLEGTDVAGEEDTKTGTKGLISASQKLEITRIETENTKN